MSALNPEMLILAREALGMTQKDLATVAELQQGTISKLEAGLLDATESTLTRLAEAVQMPTDFLRQRDRVFGFNSAVFFHRKRQALPEKSLKRFHAYMNMSRMRVDRLLRSAEVETVVAFRKIEISEYQSSPEQIAGLVRSMWLLPPGPIRNLTQAIEDAGGVVVRLDFGTKQCDAISEWIPGYPPLFLVNANAEITGDRLRRTLAHEVGHAIMHSFPNPDMEKQADEFASEFLMPRKEIKASLYNLTLAKLAQLKATWRVSMATLLERAYQLKTISETQRRYFYMNLSKRGWRTREPIETDIPVERPTLLNRLTRAHIESLGYSCQQLMNALFLTNETEFRSTYLGETGHLKLVRSESPQSERLGRAAYVESGSEWAFELGTELQIPETSGRHLSVIPQSSEIAGSLQSPDSEERRHPMSKPNVHVVPRDGGWAVVRPHADRASALADTQADAIDIGRQIAQNAHSELIIHRPNGQIRDSDSYGSDPFPPRDNKH
jgi:Zn-dependent peptidase ImmA (M78 family)/transcriptional regulator with XRE-family HTH domain